MTMTTLISPTLAPLLARSFQQDQTASITLDDSVADLSAEEQSNLMERKPGYPALYQRLKHISLAISRQTGQLLYLLACACGAWLGFQHY